MTHVRTRIRYQDHNTKGSSSPVDGSRKNPDTGSSVWPDDSNFWRNSAFSLSLSLYSMNKARPLCDLIKLNTILAQEYVAGKASTGTHVNSDLLNTGRFYMALYPPIGNLTSRLRGYLSSTTSRGHLGTTYMVSLKDKYRDI
jgi:hypothetical protein